MNRRLESLQHPTPADLNGDDMRLGWALTSWTLLVNEFCERLWPKPLFPNWLGSTLHPMTGFVAACLVHDPTVVDADEWVPDVAVKPVLVCDIPIDDPFAPAVLFPRLRKEYVKSRLLDAIARSNPLTFDDVERIEAEADERMRASMQAAATAAHLNRHRVLPLPQGMTSADIRSAERGILECLDDRPVDRARRNYALFLAQNDMPITDIAGHLGVDRKTIRSWVRGTR